VKNIPQSSLQKNNAVAVIQNISKPRTAVMFTSRTLETLISV